MLILTSLTLLPAAHAETSAAAASWWDVVQADSNLDLVAARELALAVVTGDPAGADAVAVSGWWGANMNHLAEPEALLSAPGAGGDPALGFVLARLEAQLGYQTPSGVLATAELAGPFGVFDTLDLERHKVPPDQQLPALGSRWYSPAEPFRLQMRFLDGWVGPPEPMITRGVYLAAWSLSVPARSRGWLVVEVRAGGYNLSVNQRQIIRRRHCAEEDPAVTWFQVDLAPGEHRLRIEMASRTAPRVRVSLLDQHGGPLAGVKLIDTCPEQPAKARVVAALPPAEAALVARLEQGRGSVHELLLAAELAELRGDPQAGRGWLEQARTKAPDDPWVNLALAQYFLIQPTGADLTTDLQRSRDALRSSRELPASKLIERSLAVRQDRNEDAERLLDELAEAYPDDPRVLELWTNEAVRRGWVREAEESLERLRVMIPGSPGLSELRLDVLAGLEQWDERNQLLLALAESGPDSLRRAEQLASSCFQETAFEVMKGLAESSDSPAYEVGTVSLLLESGRIEEARQALGKARQRWGDLPVFDSLDLVIAAGDESALIQVLDRALERQPWDLDLRSLSWRRGREPFYAPFLVDGLQIAAEQEKLVKSEEVDAALLLDQAVERIYPDGSSIYYYHGITRALTPAGARQAAALQHLPDSMVLRLRIIKPNGDIVVPPELEHGATNITLNDVEAGDLVEEEYLASLEPTGATRRGHLSPYTYRFADAERAFGLSEYVLMVPEGIELQIDGHFDGLERKQWQENGLTMMSWRAESVPPIPREPFGPPAQKLLPWVAYGFGVTWQDVGDAIRDQVLPVLRGNQELFAWSTPLLAKDDPLIAVKDLVEALSEEVEVGRNTLSLGTLAGANFTYKKGNRLGILATALIEAGWTVDLALARPRAFAGTQRQVPSTEVFYQPLLRVARDNERVIWIDTDEDRRGVDHISPLLQGSDALVLPLSQPQTEVSYLEQLPEMANPDLEDRQRLIAEVDTAGNARITLELPMFGARAERMLQQVRSVPEDRVNDLYAQIANRFFPGANQIEGSIEREPDGALLSFNMELPDACELSGTSMTCRGLIIGTPLAPALASLPERKFPIVLQLPIERRSLVEIVLPPGYTVPRQPRRIKTRWGEVSETLEIDDRIVRSNLFLQIPAQTVSPAEYPEFARFCLAIDELSSRPPELHRLDQ